jgi:hypothetical protein
MGNRDGEEGGDNEDGEAKKVARVDERRYSDAENARARESENDWVRAETKAELCRDATKSIGSRCVAGGRSGEEEGVMGRREGEQENRRERVVLN